MGPSLLELLRCPRCGGHLSVRGGAVEEIPITGYLYCDSCSSLFSIRNHIPRFTSNENYADNFGLQWNRFKRTQLDSYTGSCISHDRFIEAVGPEDTDFKGKRILDVGCGSGRFAEIALMLGASVVAVDYSTAVDACAENLRGFDSIHVIQGDVYHLPLEAGQFDCVYSLGVLQHTPDVKQTFSCLARQVRPGGKLIVDIYPLLLRNLLWSKYWIRPFTIRIPPVRLMRYIEKLVASLMGISRVLGSVPLIGRYLKYAIPIANYWGVFPLSEDQLLEWSLLDTYDMLSARYDKPKTAQTLRSWFVEEGFQDVVVYRKGFVIGRGRKPYG